MIKPNALTIKDVQPPTGWRNLRPDELVEKEDRIAHVSDKITWVEVDNDEIGKLKKFTGRFVIRSFTHK